MHASLGSRWRLLALGVTSVSVVLLALLPAAGLAATPAKTLGPAPIETDCLTWGDPERGCFYDINFIEYSLDRHIVNVGDELRADVSYQDTGYGWGFGNPPPGTEVVECDPPAEEYWRDPTGRCTLRATERTNGWRPAPEEMNGSPDTDEDAWGAILRYPTSADIFVEWSYYTDGDFIAVVDDKVIEGFITDSDDDPLPGRVWITGQENDGDYVDLFADTDSSGYYNALVGNGVYSVRATTGADQVALCVKEESNYCREKELVTPNETVDFREDFNAEISGKVLKSSGKPARNIPIEIRDSSGDEAGVALTDENGAYSRHVDDDGTFTVKPLHSKFRFAPETRTVSVENGDTATADFEMLSGDLEVTLDSQGWEGGAGLIPVTMTIENTGKGVLGNLTFPGGEIIGTTAAGYPEGDRGELQVLGGPVPALPTSLEPGQKTTHSFALAAVTPGRVAAYTEATMRDENGDESSDAHTLKVQVGVDATDAARQNQLLVLAGSGIVDAAAVGWGTQTAVQGQELARKMRGRLSAKERQLWLGSNSGLEITPYERALANQRGMAPELVAASTPNGKVKDQDGNVSLDEFNASYDKGRWDALGQHATQWLEGAKGLGKGALKFAKDSWSEAAMLNYYMFGNATQEETVYMQSYLSEYARSQYEHNQAIGGVLGAPFTRQFYVDSAQAAALTFQDVTLGSQDIQGQISTEVVLNENLERLAARDPKRYAYEMGKQAGDWIGIVTPTVASTLVGGGVARVGGARFEGIRYTGPGGATINTAQAVGALDDIGQAVGANSVKLPPGSSGMTATELAQQRAFGRVFAEAESLDDVARTGGIPNQDLELYNADLRDLSARGSEVFGQDVKIGAALKETSGLGTPGAIGKVELVKPKTGDWEDILLGMPPENLGKPTVFRPQKPSGHPDWSSLPAIEQKKVLDEYKKRAAEWFDYTSEVPSRDMANFRECIGRRDTVALSHGRTATAEFVAEETARDSVVFRVRHYEVDGKVFVSSAERRGLAMGPDPDGLVLYDLNTGSRLPGPIESWAMTNWRAKMSAHIRNGELIGGGSEHGFSLIMDDVSANAAGRLQSTALGYLPPEARLKVAARIARFVGMTPDELLTDLAAAPKNVVRLTGHDYSIRTLPFSEW